MSLFDDVVATEDALTRGCLRAFSAVRSLVVRCDTCGGSGQGTCRSDECMGSDPAYWCKDSENLPCPAGCVDGWQVSEEPINEAVATLVVSYPQADQDELRYMVTVVLKTVVRLLDERGD